MGEEGWVVGGVTGTEKVLKAPLPVALAAHGKVRKEMHSSGNRTWVSHQMLPPEHCCWGAGVESAASSSCAV